MERQEISGGSLDWNALLAHVVKDQATVELTQNAKPIAVISPIQTPTLLRDLSAKLANVPRLAEGDADGYQEDIRRATDELITERDPWES